jgi:hypothetical protein
MELNFFFVSQNFNAKVNHGVFIQLIDIIKKLRIIPKK